MKKCSQCGIEKSDSEFYKSKNNRDGLQSECKECHNSYMTEYRKNTKYKECQRRWIKSDKYKEYRKKDIDKSSARYALSNSVLSGKVKKEPCKVCGDVNSQAHHPDYNKPLDVIWLCHKHHVELHKKLKKEKHMEIKNEKIEEIEKIKLRYLVKLYEVSGIKSLDGHDREIEELTDNLIQSIKSEVEEDWRGRIEKRMKEIHDFEDNPELAVRLQAELLAIINNYPSIKD